MEKQFDSIEEVFEWFLENTFDKLSKEDKRKLKDAKYDFLKRKDNISERRMLKILEQYGFLKKHYTYQEKINKCR